MHVAAIKQAGFPLLSSHISAKQDHKNFYYLLLRAAFDNVCSYG